MSMLNNELVRGFVRAEGTKTVNGGGEQIILNGYGVGNWQNPEGFMIGAPKRPFIEFFQGSPGRFDRRRTVTQVVRELCGSKYLETFWDRWEESYLGEDDIRAMAEDGFNTTRLALNANALMEDEPGIHFNEKAFARLMQVLDWCEKYHIYAILDMHGAPGGACGCCGDSLSNNFPQLFYDDESWERALLLWEELARRCKDRWIVAGYDLLNEPASVPEEWRAIPLLSRFYDEAIARIRKIDKKHLFFLEGPNFARGNQIFDHDFDPECHNWCMEVHIYGAAPEIKDLYPYLLKCSEYQVPLWIGETGSSPIHNAVFYEICRNYGIGYSLWSWKVAADEPGTARCVSYALPEDWEAVRSFCAGGPRPAFKRAQAIFDEMLENMKYKNCDHNREYNRLTKRQPDIEIPGAGYDSFEKDGSRYLGHWHLGNYLNFRLEDHTKLVWTLKDEDLPFPPFEVYPCEQRQYDPLECLALELAENEHALYTVHEVKRQCKVAFVVRSPEGAAATILCNGKPIGTLEVKNEQFMRSDEFVFDAAQMASICIEVVNGSMQIKTVAFQYVS